MDTSGDLHTQIIYPLLFIFLNMNYVYCCKYSINDTLLLQDPGVPCSQIIRLFLPRLAHHEINAIT